MLGGSGTVLLLFLINAIFRGAGDAAIAMRVLWFANGLNILLGPCLIFGLGPFPELGVTGAAIATTFSALRSRFSVLAARRGSGRLSIQRADLKLAPSVLKRLVRVSIGGMGQFLIAHAAWISWSCRRHLRQCCFGRLPIAIRVIVVTILPAWGMANAVATLVGKTSARASRTARAIHVANRLQHDFLGLVGAGFIIFAEPVMHFHPDSR
jgi:Na+-driven multidrug efflux pump